MATGRPKDSSKISPEIQQKVVECLRNGNWMETAAAFAGISKDTLYAWLRKGAEKPGSKFGAFSDAVREAQALAEIDDLNAIDKAKYDDWRAAAWRLERRNPKRFGKLPVVHTTGEGPEGDRTFEDKEDLIEFELELPSNGREASTEVKNGSTP